MSQAHQKLTWSDVVSDYLPNNKIGGVLSTTAHSLTAIVGIGILALPSALSYLGWIAGPILLFVFFACTVLSNYLLVSVYQLHGRTHSTYHWAVRDILQSRKYAMAVSTVQLVNFVLVLIAFSITGGNSMQQVAKWACIAQGKTADEVYNDQSCLGSGEGGVWQGILIFTAVEWLLCMVIRTLQGSTLSSIVGMACGIIYSLVAVVISLANIPAGGAAGSLGGVLNSTADKVFGVFNALGQISSSYGLALVLLEITDTLRQPPSPVKSMIKTTWISLSTSFVLYMLVGCGGYASQGDTVKSNILDSFDGPVWALILANSVLLINMIASYQVFAQALFDAIESWIKYWMDANGREKLESVTKRLEVDGKVTESVNEDGDAEEDEMEYTESVFAFDLKSEADLRRRHPQHASQVEGRDLGLRYSRSFVKQPAMDGSRRGSELVQHLTAKKSLASGWTNEAVLSNPEGVFLPFWVRAVARTIVVGVVALIAAVMPFFGAFVGLIGTCTYWPLSIAMPVLMFRRSFAISRGFDILLSVLLWSYLVVTLASLVGAVRTIIVGFSTYKIFGG